MADITELSNLISDKNRVVFSSDIEAKYLSDTLGRKKGNASALVFPISTEEVSAIARFAYENGIPLTPRGAGTNLVGSTIPHDGSVIVDFSLMNHILEIDKENFTAWVEPGVILEDFQKHVESLGLFYPPDPGEKRASIGGNISTNAGGMRAVKYGVTRDYVMALEAVLSDGRVIQVGTKNRKDTTGLDLKDVLVGSEGTLALITKCLLRLVGKPEESLSLLVGFNSLKAGIEAVPQILKASLKPTALEFIERKVVKLGEDFLKHTETLNKSDSGFFSVNNTLANCPQRKELRQFDGKCGLIASSVNQHFPIFPADYEAYLLLTFDGSTEEINSAVKKLKTLLLKTAEEIITLDDTELSQNVWRIRGCLVKAVEAVSEQEPLDIVVPIARVADFVAFVNKLEQKSGMQMISFGHAGDGNVHLCVVRGNRSEESWEKELNENLSELYAEARALGGLISGEHGLGTSKRDFFFAETPAVNVELMNSVKLAFDPKKLLNSNISYVK